MYNETCCRRHGVPEYCMGLCENSNGCCSEEEIGVYPNNNPRYSLYDKGAHYQSVCVEYKKIIRETCTILQDEKPGISHIIKSITSIKNYISKMNLIPNLILFLI